MAILERFADIIKANVNVILDKMEDPSKMIDQYLNDMMEDLAEVKRSTAGVMAEETRTKRMADQNQAEVLKYEDFAKKAIAAGNDGDARTFITKKQELENVGAGLMSAYAVAHENAVKMRQIHDKLASDIEALEARRQMIKAKVSIAKAQETVNEVTTATERTQNAIDAFSKMEDKASKMLDEANAMSELNAEPVDNAKSLEEKYSTKGSVSVEEELEKLKGELSV